jgi:hypothetical protein
MSEYFDPYGTWNSHYPVNDNGLTASERIEIEKPEEE